MKSNSSSSAACVRHGTPEVTLRVIQYRNPHAWIFVQGTERPGDQPKIYAAEWVSVSQLDRAGIPKNFFKPGDSLRIWASPNKNPTDNRVRLKRMERRSDGWRWAGGRGDTR